MVILHTSIMTYKSSVNKLVIIKLDIKKTNFSLQLLNWRLLLIEWHDHTVSLDYSPLKRTSAGVLGPVPTAIFQKE